MKVPRNLLILGILGSSMLLPEICVASATDVYLAQAATGAASGADCSDAYAYTFFDSSSNWGSSSSQIGPGTTVHLCGTFTGKAGQTLLTFQGSGSSTNPITLLFESGANLTSPYWGGTSDGAIDINGVSYITVNGGSNGIIQDTANGSKLSYEAASIGIQISGSNHITVENLTVANTCQHTSSTDYAGCETNGIGDAGINVASSSNVTITQNTIHDAGAGIFETPGSGDQNFAITNNTISRCNWAIGGFNGSAISGVSITGNDLSCVIAAPCNWDEGQDDQHHNAIIIYPQNASVSNVVIANNYMHDINGNTTGFIFLDPDGSGNVPGVLIYNNVMFTTTGQSGPLNAMITVGIGVTGAQIYNNTLVGPSAEGISAQLSPTIENNIVDNGAYSGIFLNSGYSSITSNYNDFYGLTGGSMSFVAGSNDYGSLSAWEAGTKDDTNSISTSPSLSTALMPTASVQPTSGNNNLTSLGISGLDVGAPQYFGVSYACGTGCVTRSLTGNWDIGAYPAGSAGSGNQPTAPNGVKAVPQ